MRGATMATRDVGGIVRGKTPPFANGAQDGAPAKTKPVARGAKATAKRTRPAR